MKQIDGEEDSALTWEDMYDERSTWRSRMNIESSGEYARVLRRESSSTAQREEIHASIYSVFDLETETGQSREKCGRPPMETKISRVYIQLG